MKRKFFLKLIPLVSFVLLSSFAKGQLDLAYLITLAESKSNLKTDSLRLCEMYVFDGIPYTKEGTLEKKLKSLNRDDIKVVTFGDLSDSQIYCRICDYVLLVGTGENQSRKYKLYQLNLVKK